MPVYHSKLVVDSSGRYSTLGFDQYGHSVRFGSAQDADCAKYKKFRFVKFQITAIRNSSSSEAQLSKFNLVDKTNTQILWSTVGIANTFSDPNYNNYETSEQGSKELFDDSTNTKWCNTNWNGSSSYIVAQLSRQLSTATAVKYNLYTAEDWYGRDPISWKVYVSQDGTDWTTVSSVTNYNTTTNRRTLIGTWPLQLLSNA